MKFVQSSHCANPGLAGCLLLAGRWLATLSPAYVQPAPILSSGPCADTPTPAAHRCSRGFLVVRAI